MGFLGRGEDQVFVNDGTDAVPGLAFAGDADTGIYLGSTDSAALNIAAGGALQVIISNDRNIFSRRIQAPLGGASSAALSVSGTGAYGFYSRFSGQSIDVTVASVLRMGWVRSTSGGSPATCFFMPQTITSPAIHPSMTGFNSIDTGVSIGHIDDDNCAFFSEGIERARWNKAGQSILDPILANSTGAVSDCGATQTTDATADVTAYTLSLADDTTYAVTCTVVGRDGAGTERCSYVRFVQAHREGGGGATISAITSLASVESDAGLDATFTVSSNDLRVSVTGKAGVTINWSVSINYIGSE